jgi:hypothetical protein
MLKPRLALAHSVGVVVPVVLLSALMASLDSDFMRPSGFGWLLIFVVGFGAYFYISTTMIRLEPLDFGEKIRTDGVTETRVSTAAMDKLLKNYDSLAEEQSRDWNCSRCREPNGEAFEYCWSCNMERDQDR